MADSDARRQPSAAYAVSADQGGRPGLALGRVTKGVGTALGKSIAVDREAPLPDSLAILVERLQAGPLGQTPLKHRRVA
ncbi:hypothetical protein [Methylobacterium organophilum]|uniref:Uncharacterized protein n=1 Tax=Methylobacterium organophilum TaxID=410 RepID=A0ABQ4TCL0_METOR|nr:hypothetical protein [Methylobacterium organophilum]UMY16228.1 hypothetical protein MMB17_16070 [Methylobacterium organophilum]GJE28796.1 hypothetical protein LKMONMHP_3670 [Methylobacterium organophilum]